MPHTIRRVLFFLRLAKKVLLFYYKRQDLQFFFLNFSTFVIVCTTTPHARPILFKGAVTRLSS